MYNFVSLKPPMKERALSNSTVALFWIVFSVSMYQEEYSDTLLHVHVHVYMHRPTKSWSVALCTVKST